jgi:hypothetical protein
MLSCEERPSLALVVRHVRQPPELPRLSSVRWVYWRETSADNAISKAISDRDTGYLLCRCAMLCRAIGALAGENDTAGFELPIPCGGFRTTDCYSVAGLNRPLIHYGIAGCGFTAVPFSFGICAALVQW